MKLSNFYPLLFVVVLALTLPPRHSHSQLAPATDPLTELQAQEATNDDLLKRQDTSLKDLTDMTDTAHEVRLFSKRG